MGCLQSKESGRAEKYKTVGATSGVGGKGGYSWDEPAGDKKDPSNYMSIGKTGETIVKEPGSIDGQNYVIEECTGCTIFVLDACDSIQIDLCKDCTFVIGPVRGSVFIRDCSDCRCVMTTRQFRTRDCKACDILLTCATRPIIESSSNLRFGCNDFHYEPFKAHLEQLGMNRYQNFWSYIHDFTAGTGTNWSFLPEETTARELVGALPETPALQGVAALTSPPVALVTLGERKPLPSAEQCFVLFPTEKASKVDDFLELALAVEGVRLVRANSSKLEKDMATVLMERLGDAAPPSLVGSLCRGKSVGLEFCGDGCVEVLREPATADGAIFTTDVDGPGADYRYTGIDG